MPEICLDCFEEDHPACTDEGCHCCHGQPAEYDEGGDE